METLGLAEGGLDELTLADNDQVLFLILAFTFHLSRFPLVGQSHQFLLNSQHLNQVVGVKGGIKALCGNAHLERLLLL